MAPHLGRCRVQAVAQASPESCLVQELHSLGGRGLAGKLQLHARGGARQLPWLERLVRHDICQVLDSQVGLVSGCLHSVQGVLPPLGADHTGSSLLQVPADTEGRVVLGTQTSSNTQSVSDTSIVVRLASGASLKKITRKNKQAFLRF